MRRFCFRLILCLGSAALCVSAADLAGQPRRIVTVVRPDPRTGKLVRSVLVTTIPPAEHKAAPHAVSPASAATSTPSSHGSLDEAVRVIAKQHSLPPQLIHSVIKVESNYNPLAVSSKGALGLMQLIPSTARRFGVLDVFNPVENIEGGAKYLRYLLDRFDNNYPLALAAYNAGEQAVEKYGGIPPFAETRNYVIQVGKQLDAAPPPAAPRRETAPALPAQPHIVEIREPDGSVRYVSR